MSSNVYVCESAWRYRLSAFTKAPLCDYPYVRERLSRVQSRTNENAGEESRGARSIRMRLISPAELTAFPESSRISRHVDFDRNRLRRNHFIGITDVWIFLAARRQRQICDLCFKCVFINFYGRI